MYAREFERIGRRLFSEHLVGGNFGNMSIKTDQGFYIKRTGTYLDSPKEPVFVPLEGKVPDNVSSEFRIHRAVYRSSSYTAIVHAHPPYAVAASLAADQIIPKDTEGDMLCPVIPVVTGRPGTDDLADNVASGLCRYPVVIARGHGTFAAGRSLDEAFVFTSLAEHSCMVLALIESIR